MAAAAREAADPWGEVELLKQQQLVAGLVPALGAQVPPPPLQLPSGHWHTAGLHQCQLRGARAA